MGINATISIVYVFFSKEIYIYINIEKSTK